MSRKIRVPKAPTAAAPLSPAWTYVLLVGTPAPGRVSGWVRLFRQCVPHEAERNTRVWDFDRVGAALWRAHGAALTAEAAAHGFAPYWAEKRRPSGDGFEAWRQQFLATHSY